MTEAHRTEDPRSIAADIAKELREHPDHWFQGALVRMDDGRTSDRDWAGPHVVCWCLEGHIVKRTRDQDDGVVFESFRTTLRNRHNYDESIHEWNDVPGRDVQDIIRLCDEVANG